MKLADVDPFIGTQPTDLPQPTGLAATWWWPKPQIGNTHPGATYPLGMVSACAYSGAYPTGYGEYALSTEGVPPRMRERPVASGVTHFQQSGTGAIRKYYNYVRVTPMIDRLDELGREWEITEEAASPGAYAFTLSNGIRGEVTVGPKSAVHRYTFPETADARLVIDLSVGGLDIPYGATVPLRAHLESLDIGQAQGEIVVEGTPLALHMEADTPHWRQLLWYDRRLMPGGRRLDFDAIRPTTMRPFGLMWQGSVTAGQTIELRIGFSLRGVDQARANLLGDCPGGTGYDARHAATRAAWSQHLDPIAVEGRTDAGAPDARTVLGTAMYHSFIKPAIAPNESPQWPTPGPYAFDICTMWDIYRTQLPLVSLLAPERSADLANALIQVCEEEGNFPIGYRMAKGSDRFSRQASGLAHTMLADLCAAGVPGIDWDWALVHMLADLRRAYGEDFLTGGRAEPISHTLDIAFAYWCTARVAERVGDARVAAECRLLAGRWRNAFDPGTGLLRESTFYEGTKYNYSYRLTHDMAGRIALAGGDEAFVAMLDRFFGYGADPVVQPGVNPSGEEMEAGYALGRFEGLNNEPDMEAPWAYMYAGRPDRTAEIVHAALTNMFGVGRGGLPGNDDSGGLSSWVVWASLGLFPVAGQDLFLVNAPAWPEAGIDLPSGEHLRVEAVGFAEAGAGGGPRYVVGARFNGEDLDRGWLTGSEVRGGGVLRLELAARPGEWAREHRPPSYPSEAAEVTRRL
ncbi:glycoside hydrolase domain-containing protein [Microbacterium sp. ZXX196]|uniref:glycoside hydrolase domain-containing protein n=1 Tax=Microbacterium sp. ZXX196 TaxID=2609291 RepID=UPI0012B7E0F6|nr:glycoside hydrolase domain-containing protein [Microbacterium sp. ZXX196]MTE22806.1 glycoside hydrolase [Microbacterium sp. ZXX196]